MEFAQTSAILEFYIWVLAIQTSSIRKWVYLKAVSFFSHSVLVKDKFNQYSRLYPLVSNALYTSTTF